MSSQRWWCGGCGRERLEGDVARAVTPCPACESLTIQSFEPQRVVTASAQTSAGHEASFYAYYPFESGGAR